MYDANTILQAATTFTATFTSAALNLPGGTPRRGLKARFLATTVGAATGTPTLAPKIQESADNTTWNDLAYPIGADTLTAAGEMFIPFDTNNPYVRLVVTQSGTVTTPSCVCSCDIGIAWP